MSSRTYSAYRLKSLGAACERGKGSWQFFLHFHRKLVRGLGYWQPEVALAMPRFLRPGINRSLQIRLNHL